MRQRILKPFDLLYRLYPIYLASQLLLLAGLIVGGHRSVRASVDLGHGGGFGGAGAGGKWEPALPDPFDPTWWLIAVVVVALYLSRRHLRIGLRPRC